MAAPSKDEIANGFVHPFLKTVPSQKYNYYELINRMIGEKKQRFSTNGVIPTGGIPQMAKSPEEIRIQRVFESCAFKSAMSFVVGNGYSIRSSLFAHLYCASY